MNAPAHKVLGLQSGGVQGEKEGEMIAVYITVLLIGVVFGAISLINAEAEK